MESNNRLRGAPASPGLPSPRQQQLLAWLAAYNPADATEAAHADAMQTLLATGDRAFARTHFEPGHFTASAYILNRASTHILLIFHGKLKRWLQPGGHFESTDRDVVAAAQREVREETGLIQLELLRAPLDLDIHAIPPHKAEPQHLHLDVRLLFRALEDGAVAGDDAVACRWVALNEVGAIESDESVQRAVRRIVTLLGEDGLGPELQPR